MNVIINGQPKNFEAPLNLYDILEQEELIGMMIAVARNGDVVEVHILVAAVSVQTNVSGANRQCVADRLVCGARDKRFERGVGRAVIGRILHPNAWRTRSRTIIKAERSGAVFGR